MLEILGTGGMDAPPKVISCMLLPGATLVAGGIAIFVLLRLDPLPLPAPCTLTSVVDAKPELLPSPLKSVMAVMLLFLLSPLLHCHYCIATAALLQLCFYCCTVPRCSLVEKMT